MRKARFCGLYFRLGEAAFSHLQSRYLMKKYNFCVVFIFFECCYSATVAAKEGSSKLVRN